MSSPEFPNHEHVKAEIQENGVLYEEPYVVEYGGASVLILGHNKENAYFGILLDGSVINIPVEELF